MGINTGALYIIFIMVGLFGIAYLASGPTPSQSPILTGPEVAKNKAKSQPAQDKLQLYYFDGATITPPMAPLCQKGGKNTHPEAIIAYSPAQANAVSTDGQIKIWVSDSKPPKIAPNEQVNRSSGGIKTPGDRTAVAPDDYLWEPALYVFPQTVDAGGKPYFPSLIRGDFDNGSPKISYGADQIPPDALKTNDYTVEYIWNVKDVGLTAPPDDQAEYNLQFVAHDGNDGRAIGCITIRVYQPPESESDKNKIPI